ncbi:MAG TPA: hypothetical protein VN207_07360 [Ktedonobacteraceae bacterium]|nr:hypothetical protein [Ktedonobacteraceae bacterium]
MEHQNQKPMETLASQMSESPEERQEKSCAIQSYRSPQVFLVGKAKRLIAGFAQGQNRDAQSQWQHHQYLRLMFTFGETGKL